MSHPLKANDPSLKSWIEVSEHSDFPIQNLPFGIFSYGNKKPRTGVAIGEYVLDLTVLNKNGFFKKAGVNDPKFFRKKYLNKIIAGGRAFTGKIRSRVSELLEAHNGELRDNRELRAQALIPMDKVKMHLPVKVGDYTDFYSSKEHATNVGSMFRDPDNALLPNWLHLPVGYHGRSSSIILSGDPVIRPSGQTKGPDDKSPRFGPTQRLDFELEMAFMTCAGNKLGERISTSGAEENIFGFVLFNDWSARDIQAWEYVPLGPFLAKSFASSISPWVVTLDALEPFRVAGPRQDPEVLPYLRVDGPKNFDIHLEVDIKPERSTPKTVCRSNFKYMYWNINQQLAHQTVNGCNVNAGDLYASGTISGSDPDSYGSMLELAWKGTKPIAMPDGTKRKFLEDGDTVILKGWARRNGVRIGFGKCENKILPAQ